jgi:hypothetical protein
MIFVQPWLLLALAALPAIWWLVRASPPAPRTQLFPALRLLADLRHTAESPERTPPWLLILRLFAAACLILGLAEPILDPGHGLGGTGPLLIVVDDGWASAADWPDRMATAQAAIAAADRAQRRWPRAGHHRTDDRRRGARATRGPHAAALATGSRRRRPRPGWLAPKRDRRALHR